MTLRPYNIKDIAQLEKDEYHPQTPEAKPKKKKKKPRLGRQRKLLKASKDKCTYCNCQLTLETVTIDHVIPRSRGGSDKLENLVACCGPCNQAKGDKTLEEFLAVDQ